MIAHNSFESGHNFIPDLTDQKLRIIKLPKKEYEMEYKVKKVGEKLG